MQYKVPQNIDLEDKIIGPLTLLQFIYLMAGGMIFYTTLKFGSITAIFFFGIPAGLLALCLAFVKIQDQPFAHFLVSLILYLGRPKQRIWFKEPSLEEISPEFQEKKVEKEIPKIRKKPLEKSELEQLAYILDTSGRIDLEKSKEIKKEGNEQKETAEHPELSRNQPNP